MPFRSTPAHPVRHRLLHRCALAFSLTFPAFSAIAADLPNPILFVTQVPVPDDFATIGSVFANHMGDIRKVYRGGDLWIRYTDGTLRNLTREAGYGNDGAQGAQAIAVRDPAVDFSGTKAVFSMLIGAPTEQYQNVTAYWQMYEISGLGRGETVSIRRVEGQPADNNNVQPTYGSDGSLIYVSDRPRNGARHLYPQLDEYESTPTPSGLWKLERNATAPVQLQHSPSGSFNPIVDSFGRIVFTRWDHLQRDQQAEVPSFGAFDWTSEDAGAGTRTAHETFPEARQDTSTVNGLRFNHFFPWMLNQDGSNEETLNHIGRHELFGYFAKSMRNDPSLFDFAPSPLRPNARETENWLQLREDPTRPGRFVGIDAPEFATHSSGQIVAIDAPPSLNADDASVTWMTPRSGRDLSGSPPADFNGRYRNPLPLSNGEMLAAWANQPQIAGNNGSTTNPVSRYGFRLYRLASTNGTMAPAANGALTGAGITKSVSWWNPDVRASYNGPLWELSPVEVRARPVPPMTMQATLEAPELAAFTAAGVDPAEFRAFLAARGLGVLVTRDVTTRDGADRQQPFNLRVPGGRQTLGDAGRAYDIAFLQFFQGDLVRSGGGTTSPLPGRRVLAQPLHDPAALGNMPPAPAGAPQGSVAIAADGSAAAIVPAERAMVWQSTAPDGTPVVRERYWLSVKSGEVRACASCHGTNRADQAGQPPAQNTPQALTQLLTYWRENRGQGEGETVFGNGFD